MGVLYPISTCKCNLLHLEVDIESTKIQYQPVNAMLHLEVDIESIVNEYSSSYGIIYSHLLLLANNLLGNNESL